MTLHSISPWKQKIIAGLVGTYPSAYVTADADGEWKTITKSLIPTAALEMYCLNKIKPDATVDFLKKVKRHLINLNMTVLTAYENHRLVDAVEAVQYRETHFKVQCNHEVPQSSEAGWEDRMEHANSVIDELRKSQQNITP